MIINNAKLVILIVGIEDCYILYIRSMFPFNVSPLENGLKYLGFKLKLNAYKIKDWDWLISKCEFRTNSYSH